MKSLLGVPRRSVSVLSNHHSIQGNIAFIDHQFDKMYAKRAYVQMFMSYGLEKGEFSEAREAFAALEKDYEDWGICAGWYEHHEGE